MAVLSVADASMTTIYISDSGDDKNDGLSLQTAIYSLKRAKELHGGRNDCSPTIHASKIANESSSSPKRPGPYASFTNKIVFITQL